MELQTKHYTDLLNRFDTHIISTKSIKSGNHYTTHARDFLSYLEEQKVMRLTKVDTPLMKAYFNHLVSRPKKRGKGTLSPSTINDSLSTLRMFSIRMQQDDVISKGLPVPNNIQIERSEENDFAMVRQILSTDEVREVFDHCLNETEQALIALAYGCGLRRSSLVDLREPHLDFQSGVVRIVGAKNNKNYTVPMSDFFVKVLKDYSLYRLKLLSELGNRERQYFVDENGKPYSGTRLNKMLKAIIQRTGNQAILDKKITLHCLRHSIATHLMDAGESFEYVKSFLGHSIADTSLIYARRRKIKNYYQI